MAGKFFKFACVGAVAPVGAEPLHEILGITEPSDPKAYLVCHQQEPKPVLTSVLYPAVPLVLSLAFLIAEILKVLPTVAPKPLFVSKLSFPTV